MSDFDAIFSLTTFWNVKRSKFDQIGFVRNNNTTVDNHGPMHAIFCMDTRTARVL